jgi:hypothetical protein
VPDETPAPPPFGLLLRRPGDVADPDADPGTPGDSEGIYLAPDFTQRHEKFRTYAGSDPRDGDGWALSLPHNCGEWAIGDGARTEVLADALRLRAELDQAIAALEAAGEPATHRIALSVRVRPPGGGGSFSITHPSACDRLAYGEQCAFQLAWWRTKPELPELGVYDAVAREGGIEFTGVRDLEAEDWHG